MEEGDDPEALFAECRVIFFLLSLVSVFVPYFLFDFLGQHVCAAQISEGCGFCGEGVLTTPSTLAPLAS